jgi:hypothetical protein
LSIKAGSQFNASGLVPQGMLETPKQANDFMKKPMNTNPFKRPFSHQQFPHQKKKIETSAIKEAEPEEEVKQSSKKKQTSSVPIHTILHKIEQLEDW